MKPIIKWAGGKRYLSEEILKILPQGKQYRFVEPFVGSGAVSLVSDYERLLWNDTAGPLIDCYFGVINSPDEVHTFLSGLLKGKGDEEFYYLVRERFNEVIHDEDSDFVETAALLIYLNKMGYNGLYRTNKDGGYNVPYGKRDVAGVKWPSLEELRDFSKRLKGVVLTSLDFADVMRALGENDVIYCDPPYLPLKSNGYTGYVGKFTYEDHERLVEAAKLAASNGAVVLISNHESKQARELYKDATTVYTIHAPRSISRCGADRVKVKEIFVAYK